MYRHTGVQNYRHADTDIYRRTDIQVPSSKLQGLITPANTISAMDGHSLHPWLKPPKRYLFPPQVWSSKMSSSAGFETAIWEWFKRPFLEGFFRG